MSPSTRRELLGTTAGLAATALAGCIGSPDAGSATDGRSGTASSTDDAGRGTEPGAASDSWPQFGADPRNTGTADVVGPGATDPELAWRYDAGTPTMNASPVVADGVAYVPGSGDPGLIHAIDIGTGEQRWSFEPAGYATSAPALVDGTLYVGTWGKRFYAIDADTGEERWSREIGHLFGRSSPAVVDGTVYVGTAGDGPSVACALLALDAATGETEWQYREFEGREWIESSPAVGDGRVYVVGGRSLRAVDAETGEEVWIRDGVVHPNMSPAFVEGRLYYAALDTSGEDPVPEVRALDPATGETLWATEISDPSARTSPAVADGRVYVAATSRQACSLDWDNDSECTPDARGRLYALDAETGDHEWAVEIEPDTRSAPAVADGVVYVGCGDGLSAVTVDGEHAWHVPFEPQDDTLYVMSSPAVADGYAFVGAADGRLRAVRSANQK